MKVATFMFIISFTVSLVVGRHHAARLWQTWGDNRWLFETQMGGIGGHFIVSTAVGTDLWARCERLKQRGLLQPSPHTIRTRRWLIQQYVTTMT